MVEAEGHGRCTGLVRGANADGCVPEGVKDDAPVDRCVVQQARATLHELHGTTKHDA